MNEQFHDTDRILIDDDADDDLNEIISIITEMPYRSAEDLAHLIEMRGGVS